MLSAPIKTESSTARPPHFRNFDLPAVVTLPYHRDPYKVSILSHDSERDDKASAIDLTKLYYDWEALFCCELLTRATRGYILDLAVIGVLLPH